jgi:hypothetical protein
MEPGLYLHIAGGEVGARTLEVHITPDPLTQSHSFVFVVHQSDIRNALSDLRRILDTFPVKGTPKD